MAFKKRIAQTPPRLTPLMGRASPKGSKNFGGTGKGIDMPNEEQAQPAMSPLGLAGSSTPVRSFCKGGKVISTKSFS
jgi:hypothetical protein